MSQFNSLFGTGRSMLFAHHGEPVDYAAAIHAAGTPAQAITAVVGPVGEQLIEDEGDRTRYRHRPVQVRLSEIAAPKRNDVMTIGGEVWTVFRVETIDAGIATVRVVRPERVEQAGRRLPTGVR